MFKSHQILQCTFSGLLRLHIPSVRALRWRVHQIYVPHPDRRLWNSQADESYSVMSRHFQAFVRLLNRKVVLMLEPQSRWIGNVFSQSHYLMCLCTVSSTVGSRSVLKHEGCSLWSWLVCVMVSQSGGGVSIRGVNPAANSLPVCSTMRRDFPTCTPWTPARFCRRLMTRPRVYYNLRAHGHPLSTKHTQAYYNTRKGSDVCLFLKDTVTACLSLASQES